MRHKYDTRAIVLARTSAGEANASLTLVTPELGLVRARAQGLRRSGAKLAPALVTFAESDVVLVHGKEFWRLAGAVLAQNRFQALARAARERAARFVGLLLRLAPGESQDARLYELVAAYLEALAALQEEEQDAAEIVAALALLSALGLDAGDPSGKEWQFSPETLARVRADRTVLVARINHGIAASGL